MSDAPEKHRTSPLAFAAITAVAVLFLVYLVLPGFVAAGWSRFAHRNVFHDLERPETPATRLLFTPAEILSTYSPMHNFYYWEYYYAGGRMRP